MIDKNDVKMPVQKDNAELMLSDKEQVRKIEDLLDLVNSAENNQELRLGSDYYSRFHWFGDLSSRNDKSYFSYQEEAVYDFIFNLNKSGILSDQVGMGKTIEAGMIISELASRSELRSLLIIVPNEIMSKKWEYELASKFGIQYQSIERSDGRYDEYPGVKALSGYDDFCHCVFDCIFEEKFVELSEYDFKHIYKSDNGSATLTEIVESFVKSDIEKVVELVNSGFEINEIEGNPRVKFDGSKFSITGTKRSRVYSYDNEGAIKSYINGKQRMKPETVINSTRFANEYRKIMAIELKPLYTLIGDYFTTQPDEISGISESMTNRYPILVIPIAFSERVGDKVELKPFLNRTLLPKIENYKHKYFVQNEKDEINAVYEDYRIIDFFIDVGYQTLIVDEVHDYIDVCAKVERSNFHTKVGFDMYPSGDYNRYELFDDYYFIKKSSLYKKLKGLADKANRKIFLTATPIKSDMVDFYLLTLLASNKDSEAYKKISNNLEHAFPKNKDREDAIDGLYQSFKACAEFSSAEQFCKYAKTVFLVLEKDENGNELEGRYKYPYFNNHYLRENLGKPEVIKKYLLSHISYMSMEEIVLELILAYNAENKDNIKGELDVRKIIDELNELLGDDRRYDLQTRVMFRTILNNTIKMRFEEDFTNENGKPIKRIRELLELDDGPRKWNKTYRKYGIRHTRHQTYNLGDCPNIEKLNKNKIERYKNLPIWPRRDGKVIFLLRDDIFFDSFLDVKRQRTDNLSSEIKLEDLPNYDQLTGSEAERTEKFNSAMEIFNYINNSMSGGSPDTHEPQSSKYESVDLDDAGMVDYKLALVNKLMTGHDSALGSISKKVLLFAENDRDAIVEWFKYQGALGDSEELDPDKLKEYERKWSNYTVEKLDPERWKVSEDTSSLENTVGNVLIIIDPKRYEKGVDLQKADTIINFDINYDPLKMEQRIGRIDRIRPQGQSQEINIVSFVPLNDMSGFVINFFANELKMFTQWMGETTGIVSVPEEEGSSDKGEDVSFEGKVYNLEKYYKDIYELCKGDVSPAVTQEKAENFRRFFGTDEYRTKIDFGFLRKLRPYFDGAFRNSISPQRNGYTAGSVRNKVIRFNSAMGVFNQCESDKCANCPTYKLCKDESKAKRNVYADFAEGVRKFFTEGKMFYENALEEYQTARSNEKVRNVSDGGSDTTAEYLKARLKEFNETADKVIKLLPEAGKDPFIMPLKDYEQIFEPMKKLYWDDVVRVYLDMILSRFHKQCDSVLSGANLFERFIKSFSIADFMNNMEGAL